MQNEIGEEKYKKKRWGCNRMNRVGVGECKEDVEDRVSGSSGLGWQNFNSWERRKRRRRRQSFFKFVFFIK